ncbi:MAG: NAD-dependent epimerase/dehydratase family protein [Planctomycetota bacterium]|nr:MAG: NAD-dependent epimerase/dehydratase family protein [Planctomycetota bacterium]
MNAVVTGAHGTVGRVLVDELRVRGARVAAWDRQAAPPLEAEAGEDFLRKHRPSVLFHLAIASQPTGIADESRLVNVEWPALLARVCLAERIQFVFTSTVMVFTDREQGPYHPADEPDAAEGYGFEKRLAEQRVRGENPEAIIARLGWQIGDAPGSNNMLDYLESRQREHGCVRASERWLPACSFLRDTAMVLCDMTRYLPGTYHLDSNRGWSFARIASALSRHHDGRWKIEPTQDYVYDQRMIDPRVVMPSLDVRFGEAPMPHSILERERDR